VSSSRGYRLSSHSFGFRIVSILSMAEQLRAWVRPGVIWPSPELTGVVDLGGSLAVASRGLFATGVSTDLNGKLFSGGSICIGI
jgi:hypothetical protein